MSLAGAEILLAFKAGRAFRREGTNRVEPSPVKGAIYVTLNGDDGLLHFIWKNRLTNSIEEVYSVHSFYVPLIYEVVTGPYSLPLRRIFRQSHASYFWEGICPQILVVQSEALCKSPPTACMSISDVSLVLDAGLNVDSA